MRGWLAAGVLLPVLLATALNPLWGGLWVASVALVWRLRRRLRAAPVLLLVAIVATVALGARRDWFGRPPPRSYASGELAGLPEPLAPSSRERLVARVRTLVRDELSDSASDLERRAAAAVAVSRALGPWRHLAPDETAALAAAVRRLALTLTAPEFRDLDGRRRRLAARLEELERRVAAVRDEADEQAVGRLLDPAVLADVSLRPLREDLEHVDAALLALVRSVGDGDVAIRSTSRLVYLERESQIVREDRHVVMVPPALRITRVGAKGLWRTPAAPGLEQELEHEAVDGSRQPLRGSAEITPGDGARELVVVDRRRQRAEPSPVRGPLRWLAFLRLRVDPEPAGSRELRVTVALDRAAGLEVPVGTPAGAPPIREIEMPSHALHWVSRPGTIATGPTRDRWAATEVTGSARGAEGPIVIELVPATRLLRNRIFARIKPYVVEPTPLGALVIAGLAAVPWVARSRARARGAATRP